MSPSQGKINNKSSPKWWLSPMPWVGDPLPSCPNIYTLLYCVYTPYTVPCTPSTYQLSLTLTLTPPHHRYRCPRTQAPWQDFFCVQLYHGSSYLQVTIILCVYPILTLITHCINTLELTPSIKPLTLTGTSMRREHQGRNKKNRTFWISQKVKQPPSITPSFALPHTFSNTPNTPPHILFTTHTHISLTSSLTHSNITH